MSASNRQSLLALPSHNYQTDIVVDRDFDMFADKDFVAGIHSPAGKDFVADKDFVAGMYSVVGRDFVVGIYPVADRAADMKTALVPCLPVPDCLNCCYPFLFSSDKRHCSKDTLRNCYFLTVLTSNNQTPLYLGKITT